MLGLTLIDFGKSTCADFMWHIWRVSLEASMGANSKVCALRWKLHSMLGAVDNVN